jgi:hypothetical protein
VQNNGWGSQQDEILAGHCRFCRHVREVAENEPATRAGTGLANSHSVDRSFSVPSWVLFKLLMNVGAIIVLLMYTRTLGWQKAWRVR